MNSLSKFLILISGGLFSASLLGHSQSENTYVTEKEDLYKKTEKLIFIKVVTDKKEAYLGEGVLVTYKLYVGAEVSGKLAKAPSFKGFASYEMNTTDRESYTVEQIGGKMFRAYTIKTVQVFGLRTGMQKLEPVEIDIEARYKIKNTAIIRDTIFSFVAKSNPVDILIKQLPPSKPDEKIMGIGLFSLQASVSKPVVPALQADTVSITIEGQGNWHEVKNPVVEWPEGLEVFEPVIVENLEAGLVPVSGTRTIKYPVVASSPGNIIIPEITFYSFNPDRQVYQTTKSEQLQWQVVAAKDNSSNDHRTKNKQDAVSIFSKIAVIIFPVAAIALLIVLLGKRKKD
jgi:hypothetical protein